MNILTIEDVMQLLKCGRKTATRILSSKNCPTLPRVKGGKYLVLEKDFYEYIQESVMRGRW